MSYDSKKYTIEHQSNVRSLMGQIESDLGERSICHDVSKLLEPEKAIFDEFTPKLKASTYGSDEYKAMLKEMGTALQHHYENNRHHPEHFENGINGMSLLDLVEMLADWKAAGMRHANGDMQDSLKINKERFGMSDQLFEIFQNTVEELGW